MQSFFEEFRKKVDSGYIIFKVIDGLDASGKGEITNALAKIESNNGSDVILRDYPEYKAPWGKVLKYLLRVDDKGLSIQERMSVYALNRLETIDSIIQTVNRLNSKKITIIFDRFFTSNIMTIAYFLKGRFENIEQSEIPKKLKEIDEEIKTYLDLMFEVDREFIEILGVINTKVCIPQISPRISLERLSKDPSRDGADKYETPIVQTLSDYLYSISSEYENLHIKILKQQGKSPENIASDIYKEYRQLRGSTQGKIIHLKYDETIEFSERVQTATDEILNKFPKLKTLVGLEA